MAARAPVFFLFASQYIDSGSFILVEGAAVFIKPSDRLLAGYGFSAGFRHDMGRYAFRMKAGVGQAAGLNSFTFTSASIDALYAFYLPGNLKLYSGLGISLLNADYHDGQETISRDTLNGFEVSYLTPRKFLNQGMGLHIPAGIEYPFSDSLSIYTELSFMPGLFRLKRENDNLSFNAHSGSIRLGVALGF